MKSGYIAVDVTVVSQYALIFFSVTSKYSVDEPMIYKLSEFKKIQVMKNKHVLLKIKKTTYCIVCCHPLELSNFMTNLNSKAQVDRMLVEHIATM
jgi:molybdenum cofactor biosynthesis enzyme